MAFLIKLNDFLIFPALLLFRLYMFTVVDLPVMVLDCSYYNQCNESRKICNTLCNIRSALGSDVSPYFTTGVDPVAPLRWPITTFISVLLVFVITPFMIVYQLQLWTKKEGARKGVYFGLLLLAMSITYNVLVLFGNPHTNDPKSFIIINSVEWITALVILWRSTRRPLFPGKPATGKKKQ